MAKLLLDNFFLGRPYDNLGLPGAELIDVQSNSDLVFVKFPLLLAEYSQINSLLPNLSSCEYELYHRLQRTKEALKSNYRVIFAIPLILDLIIPYHIEKQ